MSDENRVIPIPRPRQSKNTSDETDATPKVYENYTITPGATSLYDSLNEQLGEMRVEMQKPIPTPRSRMTNRNYENTQLNNHQPELPPKTGAIRKTINIPKLENDLSDDKETSEECDEKKKDIDDIISISSSTSGKSNNEKYTTPRPSDILKTIGTSSKMLTESISERIGDKAAGAKHKLMKEYKHSTNALKSLTSDTKMNTARTLKNVKEKFENLSLKRNKARRSLSNDNDDRPKTVNLGNEEMFQSLTFNSPMNNQRSYNFENIPAQISTYEVPKNVIFKYKSNEDLPTYDDVIKNEDFLKRNTKLTQSLHGMQKQNNIAKNQIVSDTRLNTISSDDSSISDDGESSPPTFPAPQLSINEPVYGRVKKIPNLVYENAPIIPLRKPPPPPNTKINVPQQEDVISSDASNRVTISSTISDSFGLNENFIPSTSGIDRSESWRYVSNDNMSQVTIDSEESVEPIYANDENEKMPIPAYVSSPPLTLLEPTKILNTDNRQSTITRDILNEFDPLSRESFDQFVTNNMNHLTLLETLLGEETYGTIGDDQSLVSAELIDETSSDDLNRSIDCVNDQSAATVLASSSAVQLAAPTPLPPERKKHQKNNDVQRHQSVIIHQNLSLKDSIENLVEPFLAKTDDQPSTSDIVNLGKPKAPTTSWFVDSEDSSMFAKNNLDNPKNYVQTSADKVMKTIPQLTKVNNFSANRDSASYLPSYEESKNDEIVKLPETTSSNEPQKSRSIIFSFMNRKSNVKEKVVDAKCFVPRPPFGEEPAHSNDKSNILFKLPSGVIEDMLKELNPRFIELKKRQFKAFADQELKILKEHLDLNHLTSIHHLVNHKFSDFKTECGRQIHCFEINLAVPKNSYAGSNNGLVDNKGSPLRTQRVTNVYGIHSKQEKCMWMQKIIRSLTNVFPKEYTCDYVRSGWCYMKKSITSAWSGTWILLSRRRLLFYDFIESRLEILDLRKARCIGLKENDESIYNLYVEKGPIMLIDSPPYTCYFIMNTTRETKIWSVVIKDEAHANGTQLRHQQLTKDNVPVFVDKCINFVYTNGTMSEGIYRKMGSTSNIQKLMSALRKDAFEVQITRCEFNEHDVASALKRFFRELPEPLMGKLAVSFLSVSEMKNSSEKIQAYRELLQRLPIVEYQTIKKILGHLHFIQTQKDINKMKAENLAMIFGPTLMQPQNNENQYTMDHRDSEVIAELIINYKKLFELSPDEIKIEQIMLNVLKKYHNAAENLSDAVRQSGDFKVWITLDPNPELNTKQEDKKQINLSLTPTKTVYELCKELESQMKLAAHQMTLMEVILNGELQRPLHHNERVLNVVLRWASWPEADRKTNFLELRPQTKFQQQIERSMKTLPSLMPCMELKFADRKTKSMKLFTLELIDTTINVLKAEKNTSVKVKNVDVSNCITYLGAEKKRDNQCRWALTLVELNFNKRSRDSPFIGHIIAGNNINDQITWYTSIMYSIYGYDISPNPEIVIT